MKIQQISKDERKVSKINAFTVLLNLVKENTIFCFDPHSPQSQFGQLLPSDMLVCLKRIKFIPADRIENLYNKMLLQADTCKMLLQADKMLLQTDKEDDSGNEYDLIPPSQAPPELPLLAPSQPSSQASLQALSRASPQAPSIPSASRSLYGPDVQTPKETLDQVRINCIFMY